MAGKIGNFNEIQQITFKVAVLLIVKCTDELQCSLFV